MKKLSIPSKLAEAARVHDQVIADARASGYSDSACFAIRLALDEALSNAIHHGNRDDASKHIGVQYDITEKAVSITVCDEGPGFKPDKVPDPTLDENLECPHGRGVMLMRAYMTHVSFNDRGNCVTLVKERNCKLPERA
ncbi:MAG: ATP-binding protein [Planctomycetes bacterium]|nr:ATP-binding protein [Planctomycetota bacterium]